MIIQKLLQDSNFKSEINKSILSFKSRLLERQLFSITFEKQPRSKFIQCLLCYQNSDGGFGNGLEPDLMTPDSSPIAVETALYYFDCISYIPKETASQIITWVEKNINNQGFIENPIKKIEVYPHQPWWLNPDNERILAIIGLLLKLGVEVPLSIREKVYRYAKTVNNKDVIEVYDYPVYLFSLYCHDFEDKNKFLNGLNSKIKDLSNRYPEHFIPFTRYWKFFKPILGQRFFNDEKERLLNQISSNLPMPVLYKDLPWWNSIFFLDYLISANQYT